MVSLQRCAEKGKLAPPGVWEVVSLVVVFVLLSETEAWWVFGGGDRNQCPRRGNSKASISTQRQAASRCSGGRENLPAGYSKLSLDCIKGCARNYRCHFGSYSLLGNNCHKFANRLSEVLCTRGTSCPSWCLGSCKDAVES
uniref:Uncharacterized protein n=1 Tax=Magallana gigas TaxID=29159 RepID=K1RWS8_MAGGI